MSRVLASITKNPVLDYHPDTLEVLRGIYGLDEEKLAQSIDILEDWTRKQNHFVNKDFGRENHERLIIHCKGSVEKVKSQIDKLCTLKTLLPKFFVCGRHNVRETINNINDISYVVPLPKMTKDYKRVYVMKLTDGEYSNDRFMDFCRTNLIIAEYLKMNDYVDGLIAILDYRGVNLFKLLPHISLTDLQQFATILIEGHGAKVKGVHFVNESKIVETFVKTIKSVLPQKIAKRFHVNNDISAIYEVVDRDILPSDMGGMERPLDELRANLTEEICSEVNLKRLKRSVESRTNESLRQIATFNNTYMGLPGSFRTLTVD